MVCDIVITGVSITPNPVQTGKQYIISIQIEDALFVLGDEIGRIIDNDGLLIEAPDAAILTVSDNDGAVIVDDNEDLIEIMEE
ncbi:MAG: hypothetical protein PHR92_10165 [Lachnospiraceae bacterium]|nr:hypothetical protein [Lachnospiraceae bacterium]